MSPVLPEKDGHPVEMSDESSFPTAAGVVLTVSQLTSRIKDALERDFPDVWVAGELSRVTRAASGHVYLTLKDEAAVLNGIIWRPLASGLRFRLEEGLAVVVRGSVEVYAPRGSYQLIIREVQPRGVGALQLAFRQLVERLEKEGLFSPEHKKPLPQMPTRIGIVTSPTGAAVRDIVNVISRRWPLAELFVLPRRVQGAGAAEEIAAAVALLNEKRKDLDLVIVGRGGGSLEDLWAFNEEVLARAIYASGLPIVSAVGHEIDFSICDFVADLRAATPTEAGELAAPDRHEVARRLEDLRRRMAGALQNAVAGARQRLDALARRRVLEHPETALHERAQTLDRLLERLSTLMRHALALLGERLRATGAALEALSPLRVLERGYSITFAADGAVLRSARDVAEDDMIRTRFLAGEVDSRVTEVRPGCAGSAREGHSDE